jgi:hypothetical protein
LTGRPFFLAATLLRILEYCQHLLVAGDAAGRLSAA